jgi:hypothetical protein
VPVGSANRAPDPITKWSRCGLAPLLWLLLISIGCGANYGGIKRSDDIRQQFERGLLRYDLTYYVRVDGGFTIAVIGLAGNLVLESNLWQKTATDSDVFNTLVSRTWEDYGYTVYGAELTDPEGNRIGLIYTAVNLVSVKFIGENRIQILMDSPWTRGPGEPPSSGRIP